jgi:hypothetical protein
VTSTRIGSFAIGAGGGGAGSFEKVLELGGFGSGCGGGGDYGIEKRMATI